MFVDNAIVETFRNSINHDHEGKRPLPWHSFSVGRTLFSIINFSNAQIYPPFINNTKDISVIKELSLNL